jgi:replicative DNA helicase
LISSFGLKGVAVKIKFQINQASRRSISKVDFVYLYKAYYAKSSLRKYCKEGTSIVTHFLIPAKKKEEKIQKIKKNIFERIPKK